MILTLVFVGCSFDSTGSIDETSSSTVSETDNTVQVSLSEKLINEIDDEYLSESKLPEFSTTMGMIELSDRYADKWRQIADEYYNKIMEYDGISQLDENNYSSDDLHSYVSEMKANWDLYYQEQCESYVNTLRTIYDEGFAVGPMFAEYKYEMQKDWALQLVEICERLRIE